MNDSFECIRLFSGVAASRRGGLCSGQVAQNNNSLRYVLVRVRHLNSSCKQQTATNKMGAALTCLPAVPLLDEDINQGLRSRPHRGTALVAICIHWR